MIDLILLTLKRKKVELPPIWYILRWSKLLTCLFTKTFVTMTNFASEALTRFVISTTNFDTPVEGSNFLRTTPITIGFLPLKEYRPKIMLTRYGSLVLASVTTQQ
jgi:hypothetical protein